MYDKLLVVLLAGIVSGIIAGITTYLLCSSLLPEIRFFIAVSLGISVAFIVEGVLKRESLKIVILRKVIPALIGICIAVIFIFNYLK